LLVGHPSWDSEARGHPRTSTSASANDAPSVDLARIHVLAVDDEPDALALVSEVLQTAGARVAAATSGADARSEDRMKALRAGFQMHLAKPIDPAELVTTVAALAKRFLQR
jgi:CheY-like chemotaxis protein